MKHSISFSEYLLFSLVPFMASREKADQGVVALISGNHRYSDHKSAEQKKPVAGAA